MTEKNLPPVILASGSPRRRELLTSLGVDFQVEKPDVDEDALAPKDLSPSDLVMFLSRIKAETIAFHHQDNLVIGADTIVVIDDKILGKPVDEDDAFKMLNALQGNMHEVYSGITVMHQGHAKTDFLATKVWMKPMTKEEIQSYVASAEPMDKAGAYAIQGKGSVNIQRIEGCYFNVVGMSLYLLNQLFGRLGFVI